MDKYEVDEILNLAIMSKTPYFIVEGVDDICLYEAIASSANVECEIYSVEMLDGLSGGNNAVIEAMETLEALRLSTGKSVEHYVLGIVDRDARLYRNELPTLPSVLCLNLYSIESHFVSKEVIKPAINLATRISVSDEVDVDLIFSKVELGFSDVYYFALDALKNSVVPNYQSIVAFSSAIGRRKDLCTIASLNAIKTDLDLFATEFNLEPSLNSMREFVKGKWLLTIFSEELFKEIEQLTSRCKSNGIKQCRMCSIEISAPCLFRVKEGVTKNTLYSLLKSFVKISDFQYVQDSMVKVRDFAAM